MILNSHSTYNKLLLFWLKKLPEKTNGSIRLFEIGIEHYLLQRSPKTSNAVLLSCCNYGSNKDEVYYDLSSYLMLGPCMFGLFSKIMETSRLHLILLKQLLDLKMSFAESGSTPPKTMRVEVIISSIQ